MMTEALLLNLSRSPNLKMVTGNWKQILTDTNMVCVSFLLDIQQRGSNIDTWVFMVQLSSKTSGNDIQPNRINRKCKRWAAELQHSRWI